MNQSLRLRATRLSALSMMLMLSLVLFQCGKKDDDPTPSNNGIAGEWKMTGFKVSPADPILGDDLFAFFKAFAPCFSEIVWVFNANGTSDARVPNGCAVDEGDVAEQTGIEDNAKWAVSGNKLIFTNADGSKEEFDLKLSGQTMEWSQSEKDPDDGKTYTYTLVFTKVK